MSIEHTPGWSAFVDSEIGMTMGETTVKQLPDGTWKATAPIGSIFGSEVDGECSGTGPTREAATGAESISGGHGVAAAITD